MRVTLPNSALFRQTDNPKFETITPHNLFSTKKGTTTMKTTLRILALTLALGRPRAVICKHRGGHLGLAAGDELLCRHGWVSFRMGGYSNLGLSV